jgi:threonine synthase
MIERIERIIDYLTESDGGHAVTESDIREAIRELKELKQLYYDLRNL